MTKKRIKAGQNYFILIFDGQSHRVCYGKLSCVTKNLIVKNQSYAFHSNEIYKMFSNADLKNAKTGQPLRAEIRNGKLSFMVMFTNESEAYLAAKTLPKSVATRLIKKSLDTDSAFIEELRSSMMSRLSIMNEVMASKNLQEMAATIKKSAGEKNSNFLL